MQEKFQKNMYQFHVLIQENLFNLAPTGLERCGIIKFSLCQSVTLLAWVFTGNFFFVCFFLPYLFKNPVSYAAIMILWLVTIPGFLIISGVSGIVSVISHIVPTAPHLLIVGSVEAIIIAQWAKWSLDCIMWNHSIIMHTGKYWHQNFWIWGYFPHLLSIRISGLSVFMLKELYCISETPWHILIVELWFILRDLAFPTEQCFLFC